MESSNDEIDVFQSIKDEAEDCEAGPSGSNAENDETEAESEKVNNTNYKNINYTI